MAQRVFLVQMPQMALRSIGEALLGTEEQRREVARALSLKGEEHLRRVVASEMVAAACTDSQLPQSWGYARNCMPYLLTGTTADQICQQMLKVERLTSTDEIEAFFVSQAREFGAEPTELNRHTYSVPRRERVEKWIFGMLQHAAELRVKAQNLEGEARSAAVNDFAISTWVWLGRVFARTRPAFWQGRNRWLGNAAAPEAFSVQTAVTTIGAIEAEQVQGTGFMQREREWLGGKREEELHALTAKTQEQTRSQLASRQAASLDALLVSTADLLPTIGMPSWEQCLPKTGEGNCATGGISRANLSRLVEVMRDLQRNSRIPYENGNEWVELVVAAAMQAERSDAHLVEGDDSIYGAYRWPPIDGKD